MKIFKSKVEVLNIIKILKCHFSEKELMACLVLLDLSMNW